MKLESNARDVLCLIVGAQATAGALILGTLLIVGGQRNSVPRIEVDSRVMVTPDSELRIPLHVQTAPAQVVIQKIETEKIQVPDVKVQNNIQPAEVKIQVPSKPIEVRVTNFPGPMPEKKSEDPFGEVLPDPKNKEKK